MSAREDMMREKFPNVPIDELKAAEADADAVVDNLVSVSHAITGLVIVGDYDEAARLGVRLTTRLTAMSSEQLAVLLCAATARLARVG